MLQTETSYIPRYALNWAIVMICIPVSPPASDSGQQTSERAGHKRKLETALGQDTRRKQVGVPQAQAASGGQVLWNSQRLGSHSI